MQELDEHINKVKHLPPTPRILPELLSLLNKPNIDNTRVVSLIGIDPSLTANVLQLCNSAYFASSSTTCDLQEAVTRLGFQTIYRMVAAVSGAKALSAPQKGYGIDGGELWKHSVTAAVAAQLVAKRRGDDENLVFTATLLHDIGKIILSGALENIYATLIQQTQANQQCLLEAEKKLLGVQHAEIGGRLLARWKFPPNIVAAVWFHHSPANANPHQRLASYIYVGNMIAHFMGHGYGHQAFAMKGRAESLEILDISADLLPHFMIETFEQLQVIETLFHLSG
ncbi:MAG: metal dependent phosphohydrolase [Verrucomicrobiales bacterium]|nr:metal dependent phosphohydrolase [Verrucomicrobiales bacterium]